MKVNTTIRPQIGIQYVTILSHAVGFMFNPTSLMPVTTHFIRFTFHYTPHGESKVNSILPTDKHLALKEIGITKYSRESRGLTSPNLE